MKYFKYIERPVLDFITIIYVSFIMIFAYYWLIAIWRPNTTLGSFGFLAIICGIGLLGLICLKQGIYQSQKISRKKNHVIGNPITAEKVMQQRNFGVQELRVFAKEHLLTIYEAKEAIDPDHLGLLKGVKFQGFCEENQDIKYLNNRFQKKLLFLDNDKVTEATNNQVFIDNDELHNILNELEHVSDRLSSIEEEKANLQHDFELLWGRLEASKSVDYIREFLEKKFCNVISIFEVDHKDNYIQAASITKLCFAFIKRKRIHTLDALRDLATKMATKEEIDKISDRSLRMIYNQLPEIYRARGQKEDNLEEHLKLKKQYTGKSNSKK